MDRCALCGSPLPGDATARRKFCSTAHRSAAHRRARDEQRATLLDLVRRHYTAVREGDAATAYDLARQIERLTGAEA